MSPVQFVGEKAKVTWVCDREREMLSAVRTSRRLCGRVTSVLPVMAARVRDFSTGELRCAPIHNVTVIGSGLMGSGIAQVLYSSGEGMGTVWAGSDDRVLGGRGCW